MLKWLSQATSSSSPTDPKETTVPVAGRHEFCIRSGADVDALIVDGKCYGGTGGGIAGAHSGDLVMVTQFACDYAVRQLTLHFADGHSIRTGGEATGTRTDFTLGADDGLVVKANKERLLGLSPIKLVSKKKASKKGKGRGEGGEEKDAIDEVLDSVKTGMRSAFRFIMDDKDGSPKQKNDKKKSAAMPAKDEGEPSTPHRQSSSMYFGSASSPLASDGRASSMRSAASHSDRQGSVPEAAEDCAHTVPPAAGCDTMEFLQARVVYFDESIARKQLLIEECRARRQIPTLLQ